MRRRLPRAARDFAHPFRLLLPERQFDYRLADVAFSATGWARLTWERVGAASTDGTYMIAVAGLPDADGTNYALDVTLAETGAQNRPLGTAQTFFLDFDGAPAGTLAIPGQGQVTGYTPLSAFMTRFGLLPGRESQLIDLVVTEFTRIMVDTVRGRSTNSDFAATGIAGDFGIVVLNSRDHGDLSQREDISTIVIGGTREQAGVFPDPQLAFYGTSETVDIGNYDPGDNAIVPLGGFASEPNGPDTNSIGKVQRAPGIDPIQVVAKVVGQFAAQQAGRLLGVAETDNQIDVRPQPGIGPIAVQDARILKPGSLAVQLGAGADNVLGTRDDLNILIQNDFLPFNGQFGGLNVIDTLSYAASTGTAVRTVPGGVGNDVLIATPAAERFNGGGGTDTVSFANAGRGAVADLGTNVNSGAASNDSLVSIERLDGSRFGDVLRGDAAANALIGNGGNDTLVGRGGNDLLVGGAGADRLFGGNGIDTASYGTAATAVRVDLVQTARNTGEAKGDTFDGIEALFGSTRNDALLGSASGDRLSGGAGADRFVCRSAAESRPGGADVITDFRRGQDTIDLSIIDANGAGPGNGAFSFVAAFSGRGGEVLFRNGVVLADIDGDRAADMAIRVGVAAMGPADFDL